jgi:hypothetical protein
MRRLMKHGSTTAPMGDAAGAHGRRDPDSLTGHGTQHAFAVVASINNLRPPTSRKKGAFPTGPGVKPTPSTTADVPGKGSSRHVKLNGMLVGQLLTARALSRVLGN